MIKAENTLSYISFSYKAYKENNWKEKIHKKLCEKDINMRFATEVKLIISFFTCPTDQKKIFKKIT